MDLFTKSLTRAVMLVLCLTGMHLTISAQRTITGTITDRETGEALIGVTVIEKENRAHGVASDFEGKFRLNVGNDATALIFNYTGYESAEQSIVGVNDILVKLGAGKALEEVLVIGYGTVKREDATGLVQSVSTDKFNKGAITGPQDLLAGKVAGVTITSDGSPGGGAQIRIRGESSLAASKDPLIVVDGVPLDNGGVSGSRNQLNVINPNDIETFTVLKDASAAAIYGNRASGGVIIITTKKGKLGKKISVGYNGNVSIANTSNRVDVLTGDEFRSVVNAQYAEGHPARALLGNENTNWQDEIYQQAFGHDHNINASGGIGMFPYRVSLGFTQKNGLLKTDEFKRYSSAINLNPKFLNNRLQVNLSFKGILSDNHFADRGAIGTALSFDPTKPVRDTSTAYGGFYVWKIANGNPNGLATTNPVSLLELRDDNSTVKQYITNASFDYRFAFLPELRANLNIGYDHAMGSGTVVIPNYAAFSFDAVTGGGLNNYYEQTKTNSLLEAYLNYKKSFGQHGLELMGGYSWQHFKVENYNKNSDAAGTPSEVEEVRSPAEYYLLSVYGRLNYDFRGKYLFTGSLRRDGTSRFDPKYRWGLFPAAAVAIKLLDNDHKYLSNVKLRLSWGITGQQDIGDYYAYLARYQIGRVNAQYQFGDEFVTTIRPNAYVADIQWEETTTYNAGVDFSLIQDRVSGSLDVYQRNTRDLLNRIPVPALSNLSNFATANIGTMETKGVELSLNVSPVVTRKIRWDLSTNFAYNNSKITKLTTSDDPKYIGVLTGGIAGGVGSNIQNHYVGFAPSSFYVKKQLYDENGKILEGQFADLNGDGKVDDLDKYRYQNPAPPYTIGLTSSLNIGHFNFAFAGRAHIGNYVYNNVQTDMGYLSRLYGTTGYLSNVNQSAVDLNVTNQANLTFSDYFVKKASFFRLDHITAGYSFDNVIGKYFNVYVTVQNPLVITKYDGLDPEIGNGIDNTIYPKPLTYLLGFGVNF
ncbi:MAG TPA: SusC/RagA family TonB-linked outer membrane protein [Saprospiraceae bacterium]|nr:SusC/RagA family TonB-linked outer membrane protein [Saprospiraceae bacterium]